MITVVDGVVRFDRDKDADDVRLYVDPTQAVDIATIQGGEQEDHCMDGAEDAFGKLFGLN
jgi:hypothetical protein